MDSRWIVVHRPVESLWTNPGAYSASAGGSKPPAGSEAGAASASTGASTGSAAGSGTSSYSISAGTGGSGGRRGGALLRLQLGELLLGRQFLALRSDHEPQVGRHVGEQLERDGVPPDPLDRVHLELAAVDAQLLLLPEPVGHVRRGDRAEQRAGRAGRHVEAQLERLEPRGERARLVDRLGVVAGPLRIALLELLDERGRRHLGEPPREEEVARVAAGDVDDLAAQAELVDVLLENDFHAYLSPTYGRRAISRARFTATATWRWWRRHAPLMRRLRIFPFSDT